MQNRKFLFPLLILSALFLTTGKAMASGNTKKESQQNQKAPKKVYFHYLLFWLRKDLSDKEVKEFTNFFEGLKKLPYQKNLRYGIAADSTPRPVMDNSFTYNASMEFDSLEDLEAYGKLPEHIALVQKYKPYFEKMMVHDSVYNVPDSKNKNK